MLQPSLQFDFQNSIKKKKTFIKNIFYEQNSLHANEAASSLFSLEFSIALIQTEQSVGDLCSHNRVGNELNAARATER